MTNGIAFLPILGALLSRDRPGGAAQTRVGTIAVVTNVRGRAWVMRTGAKTAARLAPGQPIFAGDKIKCATGGSMELQFASAAHHLPKKTFNNYRYWFLIESPVTSSFSQGVFDALGRPAGAELGSGGSLIMPADKSTVRLGHFALVWRRNQHEEKLIVTLGGAGRSIWIGTANSSEQPFKNPAMLSALQQLADTGKMFTASVFNDSSAAISSFTLLSNENERALEIALSRWHSLCPDPLLGKMGDAQILSGFGLFNEAANAWVEAASLAPDGDYVLSKTIAALGRISDTERQSVYRARLKKIESQFLPPFGIR